jgi:hypothetical protein
MNTETIQTIPHAEIYRVALHILNAFQIAIDKQGANFRGTQSLYMAQIQALQFLALGHIHLYKKLDRIYNHIDTYVPAGYSVLHESNIESASVCRFPAAGR